MKTKRDGYRSECIPCCKQYYNYKRDQLLNNMKNYNKLNREKKFMKKVRENLISTSN